MNLCKLAIMHIDSGDVPIAIRSHMALYIANLWLRHENISRKDLLDEIGGQFAEWDVEGTFYIESDLYKAEWERLKSWVAEADGIFS